MNEPFKKRRGRVGALTVVLAALFVLVALRLAALVVFDGPRLTSLARSEHTGEIALAAPRGPLADRNGEPLALSAETRSVYARPAQLSAATSRQRAALAATLGITPSELEAKLHRTAPFVWLGRHLPPAQAQAAEALSLDGVGALSEYKRFYPESTLAAPVVGLAGMDGQGLSGLELQYDRLIRGEPVVLRFYHDALGHPILDSPLALKTPQAGARLVLTLDARIQAMAENDLAAEVRKSGARRGAAVVLDPFSGQVLALANIAADGASIGERLHDTAVQDTFEPGSTMKGLLASIALQDGTVTTRQRIYCENGAFPLAGRVIHDDSPHGWLDLGGIVEVSSNIGASKIALKLGAQRFYTGLRAFGLGARTGIDLPGETAASGRRPGSWREIDLANHGFGQGVGVTPIQLAVAYAAIANGGYGAAVCGAGRLCRRGAAAVDAYARDAASRNLARRSPYDEPAVAGRGQRSRRHRTPRAGERLRGGGQDRHGADGESHDRRLLPEPAGRVVRGLSARRRSATGDPGGALRRRSRTFRRTDGRARVQRNRLGRAQRLERGVGGPALRRGEPAAVHASGR